MDYRITTLLENVHFIHNALPELDFEEVEVKEKVFGKTFSLPFYISGMTGGYREAEKINKSLAKIAEEFNFPFAVGSQRAMIENPKLSYTYDVKKEAPDVFLIGNIGGYQLKEYKIKTIREALERIEADALAIHINPAQELAQKEGDKNWRGVEERIAEIAEELSIPIIVKEVGTGISREVAYRLAKAKIKYVDVSGAGGTSWIKVELERSKKEFLYPFKEWGIPTALAVIMCKDIVNVIASGGIKNGLDGTKALALGAKLFSSAKPFFKALKEGGENKVRELIKSWEKQIKAVLFLTGSKNLNELRKKKPFYIEGKLKEIVDNLKLVV